MVHINSLPIEILDLVMRHAAEISAQTQLPSPSQTLFPFNVGTTCALWFNILKSSPRFWRRVVIDVANDPAPFLEIVSVFRDNWDVAMDIIVFSSLKGDMRLSTDHENDDEVHKQRENSRVTAVIKHLEDQFIFCTSITFDTVYQSSLPSALQFLSYPATQLVSLSLNCSIHDFDDEESAIELGEEFREEFLHTDFPSLKNLSLTRYAFMELCQAPAYWVDYFNDQCSSGFSLTVTHFTFHRNDFGKHNDTRDLETFLLMFCNPDGRHAIYLSDLSVNYRPETSQEEKYDFIANYLTFDNISREFLMALFSFVEPGDDSGRGPHLHFKNCSIPHNADEIIALPRSLVLENIPFRYQSQAGPNDVTTKHPNLYDDSLYNALGGLYAPSISLLNCDGVDDELLWWLSARVPLKAKKLVKSLYIRDCTRFTVPGLRKFIIARSIQGAFESNGKANANTYPLNKVKVSGRGPLLSKDDADWLSRNKKYSKTSIVWKVDN